MKVLLILILVCFLLGCIRFGGTVLYDADGLAVWVRVLCFQIKVLPSKQLTAPEQAAAEEKKRRKAEADKLKKQEREEKDAAKRAKERADRIDREQKRLDSLVRRKQLTRVEADAKMEAFLAALDAPKKKPKQGGKLKLLLDLIPVGLKALGEFKDILRFDELTLEYTIPGRNDPYGAAMQYGMIAAGSGPVAQLLDSQLNIKRRRVTAFVDFCAAEALIWAKLTITLSLGDVLLLVLRALFRALRVYLRNRREQKAKAKAKQAKAASPKESPKAAKP